MTRLGVRPKMEYKNVEASDLESKGIIIIYKFFFLDQ